MMRKQRFLFLTLNILTGLLLTQPAFGLQTLDVDHQYICQAVIIGENLYFTSTQEHLVVEYDISNETELRTWDTGELYPMFLAKRPSYNQIVVLLHIDSELVLQRVLGTIDLGTGQFTIVDYDTTGILRFTFDSTGNYIYLTTGEQMIDPGFIIAVDCSTWSAQSSQYTRCYPSGVVYIADDAIYASTMEYIPTYYGDEQIPGPPYYNVLQKFTGNPRLALSTEIMLPEGLNNIKPIDANRIATLHIPAGEGYHLCIVDLTSGTISDQIAFEGIMGILDAAYSPVTEKIYATVVVDAGNYDPETEVPELAYCGHLLAYDTTLCSYNIYEDYFDSQVSMINLYEGQLIVNSIDSSKIYIDTPF